MRTRDWTLNLVLLLVILVLSVRSGSAASGEPALSVTVEPVGVIDADPLEFVHTHTTASVTAYNLPPGSLVNVTAMAPPWSVTVTPSSFVVPSGVTDHQETVSVDIEVPPRASAEQNMELWVVASTTIQGVESSDSAHTSLAVSQYYGLRLSSNGTMTLPPGENKTHRMRVTNWGNGVDGYTVTLLNRTSLESLGLDVQFDGTIAELDESRAISVLITVTAAIDAEMGTVRAYFRVSSEGDPSETADYRLTITVAFSNQPPVARCGTVEDPDDLWTNMSIHFTSNGSYDVEGGISLLWDFGDVSPRSTLADPVHVYEEPGTYNVTLDVVDETDLADGDMMVLTIRWNYGDAEVVMKAVDPLTWRTFRDPPVDEIGPVAVRRDGWVAYECELRKGQEMEVEVTVIGDRPADLYLFREAGFQTYRDEPSVDAVPYEVEGSHQGVTGQVLYSFKAPSKARYYVVIDNRDGPSGTATEGPVDFTIRIDLENPPDGEDADDTLALFAIIAASMILVLVGIMAVILKLYKR